MKNTLSARYCCIRFLCMYNELPKLFSANQFLISLDLHWYPDKLMYAEISKAIPPKATA